MNADADIRDEDLTAYLDGEASPELVRRVEAALHGDPRVAARLETLKLPRAELTEAMNSLAEQAPAMSALPAAPIRERTSGVLIAASLAVALVLGGVAGHILPDRAETDWKDFVAAYQSLYVHETLSGVDPSPSQTIATLDDLAQVLGLQLAQAADDPVLEFKRAQLLGFEGKPLVQIAYLSPAGDPVALCITPIDDQADGALNLDRMQGMAAANWTGGGYGFLVIGGTDQALIRSAAERFRSVL